MAGRKRGEEKEGIVDIMGWLSSDGYYVAGCCTALGAVLANGLQQGFVGQRVEHRISRGIQVDVLPPPRLGVPSPPAPPQATPSQQA
ncbi:MAG: hypothetical protein O7G88_05595 [bacterium]|nr:hypothetical protein [bacterium]